MLQLRDLPSVDTLLSDAELALPIARHGVQAVRDRIRTLQADMRSARQVPEWATQPAAYAANIETHFLGQRYTPVFNLTGTVIHTNLGRALLSAELWRAVEPLVTRPMNLEYDLQAGQRGDRDAIVEARLCRLTGAEAATIVNNNAAALMLVLNTLALNAKVPVSRGELIEIGGSFRLPELMARSGCQLLEVGTTNRTHPRDFENVLEEAAMLLKVHPSNYHIEGFSKAVSEAELATLAEQGNVPSCVDLGSGTLVDLTRWGLPAEPTPQSVLNQGIDIVTFSGDKLLGGVQAGMIVGRKDRIAQIKKNPMKRALRADKITLAVLEQTLKLYEQPEQLAQKLPVLRSLTLDQATLTGRAEQVCQALPNSWHPTIETCQGQIGSGALPDKTIDSVAVAVHHDEHSANALASQLRSLNTPIIGRINDDRLWLDMRGAEPMTELTTTLAELAQ